MPSEAAPAPILLCQLHEFIWISENNLATWKLALPCICWHNNVPSVNIAVIFNVPFPLWHQISLSWHAQHLPSIKYNFFLFTVFTKIIGHVGHFRWLGPNVWWEISQFWIEYIKPITQMSDEAWKFSGNTVFIWALSCSMAAWRYCRVVEWSKFQWPKKR